MTPLLFVVLVFASYRLTRIVVIDKITAGLRERVGNRWPDTPDRRHLRWVKNPTHGHIITPAPAGQLRRRVRPHGPYALITCPWCTGWWVAGLVVVAARWYGLVDWTGVLFAWPAVAGAAGLVDTIEAKLVPRPRGLG